MFPLGLGEVIARAPQALRKVKERVNALLTLFFETEPNQLAGALISI